MLGSGNDGPTCKESPKPSPLLLPSQTHPGNRFTVARSAPPSLHLLAELCVVSALSSAAPASMGKKAISSGSSQKKNKKKNSISKKMGLDRVTMKSRAKVPKENPFETIWSCRKFDILGKKRKGEERRVGLSRSHGIEKRKKTLFTKFEQNGKASVFLDKRIGEHNDALGEFDKAVLRSQRERRTKLSKKDKYNLSDGEEDELNIQDGLFPERDDFDEELVPDEEDMPDKTPSTLKSLDAVRTWESAENEANVVGGNRPKSKKEIMEEVILKSKYFKAQKAKDKEENEELIEQLDKDFTSLVKSDSLVSLTQPSKIIALKALVDPNDSKEEAKKNVALISENINFSKQDQPDSYDKLLKEMTLEVRARASDRTKTAEEIAEEERERLEKLEKERQKRMLDTDESMAKDDVDASTDDETEPSQRLRPISGDDLGDSFTQDDKSVKRRGWVDEILEGKESDDSEDEKSEESGNEDVDEGTDEESEEGSDHGNEDYGQKGDTSKDWEQSDDDLDAKENVADESHDKEAKLKRHKLEDDIQEKRIKEAINPVHEGAKIDSKLSSDQRQELPYVINAPSNMDELKSLLEDRSNLEIIEAINRIRACNAISIAAENRKKMQIFYGLLLQYFATLANKSPLNFELLDWLVKPLMGISVELPYFSAICARERILRTRMQLCEDIKDPEKSSWPSRKTLFLLRLWSMIFPCSDFRHPVTTPALLLMCEYLMRCPILSGRDAAVGSFVCSMVLYVTKQSQRFCPEVLMSIKALLMAALDKDSQSSLDFKELDLLELKASRPLLCLQKSVDEISPLNFLNIMNLPDDSSYFSSDAFRASILLSVAETLEGFIGTYKELVAFPETFLPVSTLLLELAEKKNMQGPLGDKFRGLAERIKEKGHEHYMVRRHLQLGKKKPMVKFVNPKFEENYVKGRDYDPDRERAMKKKEQKMEKERAKKEVRELRKDSLFLAELREKEKVQLEEERADKYGKALAFLQQQEHLAKSGQLGKNRKRRR